MNDIRILEASYHMDDGIHLTDVAQELVTQSFTLRSTLYQTCDIYEFNHSRGHFLGMIHLSQRL